MPVVIDLVKKIDSATKILEIEGKHHTSSDLKFFLSYILDAKMKQKELFNKSNISSLVANSDINTNLATLATKTELKAEHNSLVKFQAFDSSYSCS